MYLENTQKESVRTWIPKRLWANSPNTPRDEKLSISPFIMAPQKILFRSFICVLDWFEYSKKTIQFTVPLMILGLHHFACILLGLSLIKSHPKINLVVHFAMCPKL
jgi:hypothetical protein